MSEAEDLTTTSEIEAEPEDEVVPLPTEFDDYKMPKLWEHCNTIYKAMAAEAVERTEGLLWTGSLVALFETVGLGMAYYTPVTKKLTAMHCCRQLRRGGGPQPSEWLLLTEPTRAAYLSSEDVRVKSRSKNSRDVLGQQIRDLQKRLSVLEATAREQRWPI